MADRLLVCGGRDFTNKPLLDFVLTNWPRGICLIIEGEYKGADLLARAWAEAHSIPVLPFPADWRRYRSAAGPIRNAQMLRQGKPTCVLAFEGNDGTNDMCVQAHAAGVLTLQCRSDGLITRFDNGLSPW